MNDFDLMRLWLTYAPSIYACPKCAEPTPTRNTDEGVYCFQHWSKLAPCDECERPATSWMKIDGERKRLCRRCIIGDDLPPQASLAPSRRSPRRERKRSETSARFPGDREKKKLVRIPTA